MLNGTYLSSFGFIAGRHDGSHVALKGFLDTPSRIGKTHHNWGDENGVEPYVLASEIAFGGRDLVLTGYIKGTDRQDMLYKSQALRDYVDTFTDLAPFETKYGTYQVKVGLIQADFLANGFLSVTINMREPKVEIGVAEENTPLDPASLKTFGATLLSIKGQRYGRPETKQEHFTAYGNEGYQITKTEAPILEMELLFKGNDWTDFIAKVKSFAALLAKEGTRLMIMPNDSIREFFVVDGMQLTRLLRNGDQIFGFASIKAIELEFGQGFSLWVDNNTWDLMGDIPADAGASFELNEERELIMTI